MSRPKSVTLAGMNGLWLENGKLELRKLKKPRANDGEVLAEVIAAGICGTDLELLAGYAGFAGVPGHEFVSRVVSGGGLAGKRIVADINVSCGECQYCRMGLPHHCSHRHVVGIRDRQGAFAEYVSLPSANCVEVPEDIPDEIAVLAEPLAAALEITEQVTIARGQRVLVVGAGRLAQLIMRVLVPLANSVDAFVRNPARKAGVFQSGATPVDTIETTYDVVVECSGNPAAFETALDAVRPAGTIVMKSTYAGRLNLDASRLVVDEIALIGSRCGPMEKAVDWLHANYRQLDDLAFERFALAEFDEAFESARRAAPYKVLFTPRASGA